MIQVEKKNASFRVMITDLNKKVSVSFPIYNHVELTKEKLKEIIQESLKNWKGRTK